MGDVENVNESFKEFLEGIKELKGNLENIKKFKNVGDLEENVSLADYAQLNATMAYSLNSLYYSRHSLRK